MPERQARCLSPLLSTNLHDESDACRGKLTQHRRAVIGMRVEHKEEAQLGFS